MSLGYDSFSICFMLTTRHNVYSSKNQGLIVISEPALISDSKEFKKLMALTETSTDFHFPSLEQQLVFIKYAGCIHCLI